MKKAVPHSGPTELLSFRLPLELRAKVDALAKKAGVSRAEWLARLVTFALELKTEKTPHR